MKKILTFLFAFMAIGLVSCNDDPADTDNSLTAQLPGIWQLSSTYDVPIPDTNPTEYDTYSDTRTYEFKTTGQFYYSESSMKSTDLKTMNWSVRGSWNIRKGLLQLNYDIDTYRSSGYSEEVNNQRVKDMKDSNALLKELNDEGRAYGSAVSFDVQDNKPVLKLAGFNGVFAKISYASAPEAE